ncbi:MAG: hypothetical protein ACT4O2_00145 [Beijerinckiaceae bacterium]
MSYLDNATPPVSLAYTIDPASNRLLGITSSLAESFTYDASGNMLSYSAPFADYSFTTTRAIARLRHMWARLPRAG